MLSTLFGMIDESFVHVFVSETGTFYLKGQNLRMPCFNFWFSMMVSVTCMYCVKLLFFVLMIIGKEMPPPKSQPLLPDPKFQGPMYGMYIFVFSSMIQNIGLH